MADDGEMSVPGGRTFLGLTKPSKGIAAVLVAGFLAHVVSPYTTANFALIPAKSIPFFWNIVTAGYLETTISGLAVSIFTLLVVGRFLEPLWGSREFFKFIIFVNFFTSTITFVLAIFLYIITRVENFLYSPISGFHGVVAGFLVAMKQIMPDQDSGVFKLHVKWLPSIIVGISLLSSLFSTEPIQYVPFVIFGTYGAWMYLRYLQKNPETRLVGDHSAEFAFATFFPGPLQPFVIPISTIFHNIFCGRRSQGAQDGTAWIKLKKPLPCSDAMEASRQRERGALALEEKLVISTSEAGPEDAAPKISIGNFELVASEELLV